MLSLQDSPWFHEISSEGLKNYILEILKKNKLYKLALHANDDESHKNIAIYFGCSHIWSNLFF